MEIHEIISKRGQKLSPSPIRELFKYTSNKEIISFGGGYPAPGTFPIKEISIKTIYGEEIKVSDSDIMPLMQYGASFGDPSLLNTIKDWHSFKNDLCLDKNSFLILNGSQEGIFALGFLLIDEDDSIMITEPTYPGTISAFNAFKPKYIPIDINSEGMDLKQLENKLKDLRNNKQKMPKFIYTIPNGHNPGGVTMNLSCRKSLLEIASNYNILLVEDDPYELIRYHDNPMPTLQSLDKNGLVIRLDSFSKILMPGLRLGYASGDPRLIKMIELYKQSSNLHTSSFAQGLLYHYLNNIGFNGFMNHIKKISLYYKDKMEYMSNILDNLLKDHIIYNKPDSGLFIWLTFKDENINTRDLLFDNIDRTKVIAVPGNSFSTVNKLHNALRLSFGTLNKDKIKEGIRRLKEAIEN